MKKSFSFSRGQQLGVIVWSVIIVVLIIILNLTEGVRQQQTFEISQVDMEYLQISSEKNQKNTQIYYSQNKPQYSYTIYDFEHNIINLYNWKKINYS